jgi:hypothetical protein
MREKSFQELTASLARGENHNPATLEILNSRVLSNMVLFTIPDLDKKDLRKESILAPIIVSTNTRKLSLNNIAAAHLSSFTKSPLYVIYAHMQRTVLPDPSLFRRLCFYPEKVWMS